MATQQLLAAYGGASDPNFANVVLLMHMDGANGSTTFTDNSSSAKTMTAVGSPTISTTQSKFGGASLLTNGSSQAVVSATSLSDFDFGSGDFSLEGWGRHTTNTPTNAMFGKRANTAGLAPISVFTEAGTGKPAFWCSFNGSTWGLMLLSPNPLTINTWFFWQAIRSGNNFTLAIDGISKATATVSGALMTNTSALSVGATASDGSLSWNGNIDDVRITKGVARPLGIPTIAFPNS